MRGEFGKSGAAKGAVIGMNAAPSVTGISPLFALNEGPHTPPRGPSRVGACAG
jgi:hypothetical protein